MSSAPWRLGICFALVLASAHGGSAPPSHVGRGFRPDRPDLGMAARSHVGPLEARVGPFPGWTSQVDLATGRTWIAYGPGVDAPARELLDRLAPGIEVEARPAVRAGRADVVVLEQRIGGVPVEPARAQLRYVGGKLVFARLAFADADVGTVPSISAETARARAAEIAAARGRPGEPGSASLVITRGEDAWRLAWRVSAGRLAIRVDAGNGSLVSIEDELRSVGDVFVQGWHEPRRAGDPQVLVPFGFAEVRTAAGSYVADTSGHATIDAPAMAYVELKGLYTDVSFTESSGSVASAAVPGGGSATITWDDVAAPLSERNAYRHRAVSRARMKEMAPDVAWLDEQVTILVDIPDSFGCNAFWDGSANAATFFEESTDCNATARIADVVYHELGHGLHQHLSVGGFLAGDIGEGSADYMAATITNDPDIGPSFFKAQTEGIRNLEPDRRVPEDQTGQVHSDGLIWGGAFWDLRTALEATLGTDGGIATTDRILADTLRYDPTLEDGFYDVIFAADDDGDPTNGVPHLCTIISAFAPHGLGPGDGMAVTHLPLGAQAPERGRYDIRVRAGPRFAECFDGGAAALTLEWRLAGESAWRAADLHADLVPGWSEGTIPAQAEGAAVEYRISAVDSLGRTSTQPEFNFETAPFRFPIGRATRVFFDDFETDRGWSHALLEGPDQEGADDWQRGAPSGRASDPPVAWSGSNVWANDLGIEQFNGAYQPNIHNQLSSPAIDCRGCEGTRLRFRRWLNVEQGDRDLARVLVNDEEVWRNPPDESLRDRAWRFEEIALPSADGKRFRLRFEMQTNGAVQAGGWTIDDVEIVADRYAPVASGWSCAIAVSGKSGAPSLLVLAAVLLVRARRRT